jgi:hypothetical protein
LLEVGRDVAQPQRDGMRVGGHERYSHRTFSRKKRFPPGRRRSDVRT